MDALHYIIRVYFEVLQITTCSTEFTIHKELSSILVVSNAMKRIAFTVYPKAVYFSLGVGIPNPELWG